MKFKLVMKYWLLSTQWLAPDVFAESSTLNLKWNKGCLGFFCKWKLIASYRINSYSKGVLQNEGGSFFNWVSQNTDTIYLCTITMPFSVECNIKFKWRKMRQHRAVWCTLNTWIISSYYSDICTGKQITFKMPFPKCGKQWGRQFYCVWVMLTQTALKHHHLPHIAIKLPKIWEKTHTELCYNSIVTEVACHLHQQAQKIPAKDNLPTNCLKNPTK